MIVQVRKRTFPLYRTVLLVVAVVLAAAPLVNNSLQAHALSNSYTWSPVADTTGVSSLGVAMSSDGSDIITLGNSIYLSQNKGATWQDITSKVPEVNGHNWDNAPNQVVSMSANGQVIAVSAKGGLVMSTDGGTTWSTMSNFPSGGFTLGMSSDGTKLATTDGNYIYTSTNGGSSWTQQAGSGSASVGTAPGYTEVTMSGDGSHVMANGNFYNTTTGAYTPTGIYYSSDGGVTWARNTSLGTAEAIGIQISANGLVAITGTYTPSTYRHGQEYMTTNGGATWAAMPSTGVTYTDSGSIAIYLSADGTSIQLYNTYGNTEYTTANQGTSWTSQAIRTSLYIGTCHGGASADLTTVVSCDGYSNIELSTDSGKTWNVALLQGGSYWGGMATSSDGSKMLLTDTSGNVYVSSNAGKTWQYALIVSALNSSSSGSLTGAAMSSDGTHMVVAGSSSDYLYFSNDGGATWTENTAVGVNNWYSVAISSDGTKIAAITTSGEVAISTNSGSTWTTETATENGIPQTFATITMSPDGQHLALAETVNSSTYNSTTSTWTNAYSSHIYTSSNSGSTWVPQSIGSAATVSLNGISISTDGQTIATVDNGQSYVGNYATNGGIYLSRDGGATWDVAAGSALPVAGAAAANSNAGYASVAVSADGSTVVANDYSGENTYVSTDSGTTWKLYNHPTLSISNSYDPIALSANGSVIYTAEETVWAAAQGGTSSGSSSGGTSSGGSGGSSSGGSSTNTSGSSTSTNTNNGSSAPSNNTIGRGVAATSPDSSSQDATDTTTTQPSATGDSGGDTTLAGNDSTNTSPVTAADAVSKKVNVPKVVAVTTGSVAVGGGVIAGIVMVVRRRKR